MEDESLVESTKEEGHSEGRELHGQRCLTGAVEIQNELHIGIHIFRSWEVLILR